MTIPRGPLAGLPKRPVVDRRRHHDLNGVAALINATLFAARLGVDLNARVTVLWERSQHYQQHRNPSVARARFLQKAARWFDRNDCRMAWTAVSENEQRGDTGRGLHTHFNFHFRSARHASRFAAHMRSGVDGFDAGGIDLRLSEGRYGPTLCRSWNQQAGWLRYTLKRLSPDDFRYRAGGGRQGVAQALGVDTSRQLRHRAHGIVPGNRVAVAHAIGPAARRAAGWRELTILEELAHVLDTGSHPDNVDRAAA